MDIEAIRPRSRAFFYLQVAEQVRPKMGALDTGKHPFQAARQRPAREPATARKLKQVSPVGAGLPRHFFCDGMIGFVKETPEFGDGYTCILLIHKRSISKLLLHLSTHCSNLSISPGVEPPNNDCMDVKTARRNNLRALVDREGSIAKVARKTVTAEPYLSQILNSADSSTGTPRGMGHKVARRIEQAYEKPNGWMDSAHSEPHAADAAAKPDAAHHAELDVRILGYILEALDKAEQSANNHPMPNSARAQLIADTYRDMINGIEADQATYRWQVLGIVSRAVESMNSPDGVDPNCTTRTARGNS